MIGGYDPERGTKIVGHRGYFLTNIGVALNQALINYSLAFLNKKKYTLLQTPFMMNKDVMAKVAQLSQFDEELYKVKYSYYIFLLLNIKIYKYFCHLMIKAFVVSLTSWDLHED